jgi:hypothetical protein
MEICRILLTERIKLFPDDNLLHQNVNITLKINITPGSLHSTHTNKLKLKMSLPPTTAELAPDM